MPTETCPQTHHLLHPRSTVWSALPGEQPLPPGPSAPALTPLLPPLPRQKAPGSSDNSIGRSTPCPGPSGGFTILETKSWVLRPGLTASESSPPGPSLSLATPHHSTLGADQPSCCSSKGLCAPLRTLPSTPSALWLPSQPRHPAWPTFFSASPHSIFLHTSSPDMSLSVSSCIPYAPRGPKRSTGRNWVWSRPSPAPTQDLWAHDRRQTIQWPLKPMARREPRVPRGRDETPVHHHKRRGRDTPASGMDSLHGS